MRKKKKRFMGFRALYISIFSVIIFVIISIGAYIHWSKPQVNYVKASYLLHAKIDYLNSKEINNEVVYNYLFELYDNALIHSGNKDSSYIIYERLADQNLEFYLAGLKDCSIKKTKI